MAADLCNSGTLSVVSYNMHGFFQGAPTVDLLIAERDPDMFMLQQHWLTPVNLCSFEKHFDSSFAFVSSALADRVESDMLRGRPFGVVMTLVNKKMRQFIAMSGLLLLRYLIAYWLMCIVRALVLLIDYLSTRICYVTL